MRIAVDIDGVLTLETEGFGQKIYSERIPNRENIRLLNELHDVGCQITLFSSRYEKDRRVTEHWLHKHKVRFHCLVLDKPKYDAIVDDRSSSLLALRRAICR